mgnify:FL=1
MLLGKDKLERRGKELRSELERAVAKLKEMGAERIVLIGSMAQGTVNPYGDIDLVVVMRTQERFLDRMKAVYLSIQPAVAMDILVYTPEEFEEIKDSPFLAQALKEGRVLHAA